MTNKKNVKDDFLGLSKIMPVIDNLVSAVDDYGQLLENRKNAKKHLKKFWHIMIKANKNLTKEEHLKIKEAMDLFIEKS